MPMTAGKKMISAEFSPAEAKRLEELQTQIQQQLPEQRISRSDAIRVAINYTRCSLSSSALMAEFVLHGLDAARLGDPQQLAEQLATSDANTQAQRLAEQLAASDANTQAQRLAEQLAANDETASN